MFQKTKSPNIKHKGHYIFVMSGFRLDFSIFKLSIQGFKNSNLFSLNKLSTIVFMLLYNVLIKNDVFQIK